MKKLSKLLPKKKNQPLVVVVTILVIIGIVVAVIFTNNKKNNNLKSNNNVENGIISNNMPVNNNAGGNNNLSELENKMNNEIINNMERNDTALETDELNMNNTESKLCDSMINFMKRLKENPKDYEKFKKTSFYTPDFDSLYYLNDKALKNICLQEVKNSFPKDIQLSNKDHDDLINTLIYCLDNSSIDTLEECLKDKVIGKMLDIQLRIQGVNSVSNQQKEMMKNMILNELKQKMGNNVKNNMKNNAVVIENNINNNNNDNNYNNNSIHFKNVNHTNYNNKDIDQVSKNMYRMEAQRESNNNSISDYLRNHNL